MNLLKYLKTCAGYLFVKWNCQFIPRICMHDFSRFIKENYKHELIGVEIGVNRGKNAFNMLSTLPIKTLYLIDPYLCNELYGNGETRKKEAKEKLKRYKDKIVYIHKTSEKAINDIPNNLDFVYIDGNHDYDFVKQDIELYYPKVKEGGVFGGDDFSIRCRGVVRAVTEFLAKYNLDVCYGKSTDWWIVKGVNNIDTKWMKQY